MQLSKKNKSDKANGDRVQGVVISLKNDVGQHGNTGFFDHTIFKEQRTDPAQVRRIGPDGMPPGEDIGTASAMTALRLVIDQAAGGRRLQAWLVGCHAMSSPPRI